MAALSAPLLAGLMVSAQVPKGPVKVFILAGQSNMEGQAVVDLTGPDYNAGKGTLETLMADPAKAPMLRHLRGTDGRWTVRDDVWVRYQREDRPLLAGRLGHGFSVYGDVHHFGPELQFGHVVGDHFKNPVLLVKTAWGGKSLYRDFRPPSSGGEVGKYYTLMIDQVRAAMANLDKDFPELKGRRCELAGFVWYHGWNDGVEPKTAVPEYEQNLVNLILDVRREFKMPKLPAVIGELTGPWVKAEGGWDALRKAQAATAVRPELGGNVAFVPTHDFVRKPEDSPNPTHGHHEFGNAETYFLVGDALGKGMLRLYGVKTPDQSARNTARKMDEHTTLKDYGLKPYVKVSKRLPRKEDKPWKLVCTMPYNCQFQPWIEVEAPAGQVLKFNSSNPLVLYLTPTESCTTMAGGRTYEAKNWISGEGAVYTIPAGVTVKAVKYRETGYDTDFAGSFTCNDEDYNILWRRAAHTAYLCMRDHFYDCPDRERVGFWGDGTPELGQCFYVFDRRSDRICRELVLRKLEPSFYPGQHLEFLGEYGIWFYYLHTGDLDAIKAVYEPTKTFLLETYKFGNRNTWFDWGHEPKDTPVIETCFAYIDLGTLRKMAIVTGHAADIPLIDSKMEEIRATFDKRFWNGLCYQSSAVAIPDDRANAMAVNSGLASPDKWGSIYDRVLSRTMRASCFFDRWVFEALCKMDKPDQALIRMANRYRTMIESSFTTLWEHYDRLWATNLKDFDEGSSLNHGWNPPAIVLGQNIAGVRPIEPGWTVYEVMPKEAFLTWIKTDVPSIKGPVKVSIRKTSTRYALDLDSPPGTTAIVGIPKASFVRLDSVSLNGQEIWKGTFCGSVQGVTQAGDDGGYLKFKVPPGRWRFEATGALNLASPKPPRPKPERATALDKRDWTASASVPDGSFLFSGAKIPIDASAANAIDGDHWTGWRDTTANQYPGQWFQVDIGRKQSFDRIRLDCTWALFDYPRRYEVSVSDDAKTWRGPIATGVGLTGITNIAFPLQRARWIRITQTGSDPQRRWSIYELDVLRSR